MPLRIAAFTILIAWIGLAQQPNSSKWSGEWGEFSPEIGKAGSTLYVGQSIHVFDCQGETCQFELDCQQAKARCGGSGTVSITGSGSATATLRAVDKAEGPACAVNLTLVEANGSKSIMANSSGGDCGSYCTPGGKMTGRFPFRSASSYFGTDMLACFSDGSKARTAICENQGLAEGENRWINVVEQVQSLKRQQGNAREEVFKQERGCDTAGDARACLEALVQTNVGEENRQKDELMAGLTRGGSVAEAAKRIEAVVGRYRRTFKNEDVQGDKFKSTDSLDIRQVSATGIGFKVHLEFFNGHECEAEGTAEYKAADVFVYRVEEQGRACLLELIPTVDGIKFADPTGQCKEQSCGARGYWNGAGFSFKERLKGN